MKTKNILLAAICSLFLLPVMAQEKENYSDKKIRVHLVTDENGTKKIIDREFNTEAEAEEFIKANEDKMDAPPPPPVPPLAPAPPKLIKEKRRVKIIEKQGADIELAELPDLPELPEMEIRNGEKEERVEKTIIICKGKEEKEEAKEVQPGVKEIEEAETPSRISNLSFYPNPNSGNFSLHFNLSEPTDVHLQISDLNGNVVYTDEVKGKTGFYETNIYRGQLSNGTYLMQVTAGNEKKELKISVQK